MAPEDDSNHDALDATAEASASCGGEGAVLEPSPSDPAIGAVDHSQGGVCIQDDDPAFGDGQPYLINDSFPEPSEPGNFLDVPILEATPQQAKPDGVMDEPIFGRPSENPATGPAPANVKNIAEPDAANRDPRVLEAARPLRRLNRANTAVLEHGLDRSPSCFSAYCGILADGCW